MIRQIMRMLFFHRLEFSDHGCCDLFIHSFDHDFDLSIFFILLSHRFLMAHLLMNCKLLKLSRHFSMSGWLCQVLIALRLVPLLIINLLNLPRPLITLLFRLKKIYFIVFRSSIRITRPYFSCIGGVTSIQALLQNGSFLLSLCPSLRPRFPRHGCSLITFLWL